MVNVEHCSYVVADVNMVNTITPNVMDRIALATAHSSDIGEHSVANDVPGMATSTVAFEITMLVHIVPFDDVLVPYYAFLVTIRMVKGKNLSIELNRILADGVNRTSIPDKPTTLATITATTL